MNEKTISLISAFGLKAVFVIIGIAVLWLCLRLSLGLLKKLNERHSWFSDHYPVIKNILRIVIIALGLLIILDSLGVSITPIMASLGVGGLAIGLALKDTLANYFSGFYLLVDKPVRIGDFIRLDSGEEGYVEEIGWRSTRIRMLANNTVMIPNGVFSSGKVTNYDLPSSEAAVLVNAGVHYDSDLEKVEKITIDVAKDVQKNIAGAVKEFEPFIRYNTFADSSINFTVIMRAENFVANYLIKHEFIKRLHKKYKAEGIVIPFPIRTIYMEKE